ncbi:MAG: bacillithiol biosynthesis BshC, partial [Bryobacterales bacterium]|nr:bacillithiol biosynthesis BshC [Bryobacterales bacterium]
MGSVSLPQAELPGIRPLFADLLYSFSRVGQFYRHPPSLAAAQAAASAVRLDPRHRQALVDALAAQNRDGDRATQSSLDRLAQPGAVVVATGQQVGLLGGPAFTLYKALTAVRCADELTRRGTPATPVFWLATEDHDLAEVNH